MKNWTVKDEEELAKRIAKKEAARVALHSDLQRVIGGNDVDGYILTYLEDHGQEILDVLSLHFTPTPGYSDTLSGQRFQTIEVEPRTEHCYPPMPPPPGAPLVTVASALRFKNTGEQILGYDPYPLDVAASPHALAPGVQPPQMPPGYSFDEIMSNGGTPDGNIEPPKGLAAYHGTIVNLLWFKAISKTDIDLMSADEIMIAGGILSRAISSTELPPWDSNQAADIRGRFAELWAKHNKS